MIKRVPRKIKKEKRKVYFITEGPFRNNKNELEKIVFVRTCDNYKVNKWTKRLITFALNDIHNNTGGDVDWKSSTVAIRPGIKLVDATT